MSGSFDHTLATRMQPPIAEDFPRFQQAVQTLSASLQKHLRAYEAPQEDVDRLIGHFGLMGETNNTLGFIFQTKLSRLPEERSPDTDRLTTEWAHWLYRRAHGESQHGRTTQNGETVLQAFYRIDKDIAAWTDRNPDRMPTEESRTIDSLRSELIASFEQLEFSIEEIGVHFAARQPPHQPMDLKDLLKLHL